MKRRISMASALLSLGLAIPVSAQDLPEFKTAVPENPAFTFLGVSPSKINRPNSMRDFGVALLNGVNAEGIVQQGVALELSGWKVAQPNLTTYQNDYLRRIGTRTRLSFGTAKAATDSTSTDLGIGLSVTLIDGGDVMADTLRTRELADSLGTCRPQRPGESALPCMREKASAVWDRYNTWNASRLEVGVATGLSFLESRWDQAEGTGVGAWLVYAQQLLSRGQLIVQGTYRHTPELGAKPSTDKVGYGARLLFGSARFNAFGELIGEHETGEADMEDTYGEWSVGIEARVAKDLWISSGLGRRFSSVVESAERVVLMANVRWAVSDAGRFSELGIR